jgi:hypothetical protein
VGVGGWLMFGWARKVLRLHISGWQWYTPDNGGCHICVLAVRRSKLPAAGMVLCFLVV